MRCILLALLLAAGCGTQAAELVPGYVLLADLDPATTATVNLAVSQLSVEGEERPHLDYMPRTLGEARRLIEERLGRDIAPLTEACTTTDWILFSQAAPDGDQRFRYGWALEPNQLQFYDYGPHP